MSASQENLFLIVGLGNPGSRYQNTRHNMGFDAINKLAQKWETSSSQKKFHSEIMLIHETHTGGPKILLQKPQTFMNRSGPAVKEALSFYKMDPVTQLLVIFDDLDLPPGQLRIRRSGGPGGHNGISSIIQALGTNQFPRIRIGIGRSEKIPPEAFVLSKISDSERTTFDQAIDTCVDAVELILKDDIKSAMNQFNAKKDGDES